MLFRMFTLHVDGGNLKRGEVVPLEPQARVDYEAGGYVVVVKESLCSIVQLHLGKWPLASIGHHDDIAASLMSTPAWGSRG